MSAFPDPCAGLPPEVVATARKAKCSRCKAVAVDEPSVSGTMMVNHYTPSLGTRVRGILCGACGLAFREFLTPEILQDPVYLALKAELQARWV